MSPTGFEPVYPGFFITDSGFFITEYESLASLSVIDDGDNMGVEGLEPSVAQTLSAFLSADNASI